MCMQCENVGRRGFLSLSAAGLVGAALASRPAFAATTSTMTPDDALAKLRAGNLRFMSAADQCVRDLGKQRAAVAQSQAPWATILTCSDSRLSPELIFGGIGLGELFVARNAGNTADTATLGTIEYGAEHLGSPLVVVLGHERCGAIAAACEVAEKKVKWHGSIKPMIDEIVPAAIAMRGRPGDFVDNTVRENAKRTANKILLKSKIVADLRAAGKVKVVYARYDLDTGAVEFLS